MATQFQIDCALMAGRAYQVNRGDIKTFQPLFIAAAALVLLSGCEKARLDQQVKELCAKDGGIKVYETVRLPPEKFDKYGAVKIPSKQDVKPSDEYFFERYTTYLKTGNPEMWRSHHRIIRASDGKAMGESIHYARRGGDMPGPWHDSSFSCPDFHSQTSLENQIFKKDNEK